MFWFFVYSLGCEGCRRGVSYFHLLSTRISYCNRKAVIGLKGSPRPVSNEMEHWRGLPEILLQEIYTYLNWQDLLATSSVCKRWRNCLFHPKHWKSVTFDYTGDNNAREVFLSYRVGKLVSKCTIVVSEQLGFHCAQGNEDLEFLLQQLAFSNLLTSLTIRPLHSVNKKQELISSKSPATHYPSNSKPFEFDSDDYFQEAKSHRSFSTKLGKNWWVWRNWVVDSSRKDAMDFPRVFHLSCRVMSAWNSYRRRGYLQCPNAVMVVTQCSVSG